MLFLEVLQVERPIVRKVSISPAEPCITVLYKFPLSIAHRPWNALFLPWSARNYPKTRSPDFTHDINIMATQAPPDQRQTALTLDTLTTEILLRICSFREGRCYLAGELPPGHASAHLRLSQTNKELRNRLWSECLSTTEFALIRSHVWEGGDDDYDDINADDHDDNDDDGGGDWDDNENSDSDGEYSDSKPDRSKVQRQTAAFQEFCKSHKGKAKRMCFDNFCSTATVSYLKQEISVDVKIKPRMPMSKKDTRTIERAATKELRRRISAVCIDKDGSVDGEELYGWICYLEAHFCNYVHEEEDPEMVVFHIENTLGQFDVLYEHFDMDPCSLVCPTGECVEWFPGNVGKVWDESKADLDLEKAMSHMMRNAAMM